MPPIYPSNESFPLYIHWHTSTLALQVSSSSIVLFVYAERRRFEYLPRPPIHILLHLHCLLFFFPALVYRIFSIAMEFDSLI